MPLKVLPAKSSKSTPKLSKSTPKQPKAPKQKLVKRKKSSSSESPKRSRSPPKPLKRQRTRAKANLVDIERDPEVIENWLEDQLQWIVGEFIVYSHLKVRENKQFDVKHCYFVFFFNVVG
jgi:hypothetical protein